MNVTKTTWHASILVTSSIYVMLLAIFFPACTDAVPDYWPGRTYTTNNGTQHKPVPFSIESKITEYNEEATPRDNYLKTSLTSYTLINLWDETNPPPENKTGTVREQLAKTTKIL